MTSAPLPDGIVGSEHLGIRVFSIGAPDAQELADRIAIVLGEHLAAGDELHITYNALNAGWQQDTGRTARPERAAHMQLFFEHTALLVLRPPGPARQ
jgi:hypothetical protein